MILKKMKGEIGYRFRTKDSPNLDLMSVKEELVNVKHDQHESKPMNSLSSFPPLFYNLSFVTSVGTNHPPFQKSLAQTLQQHHSPQHKTFHSHFSHFQMSPIHIAHSTTLWSSSIPFIVPPIDSKHLHLSSWLSWTPIQHSLSLFNHFYLFNTTNPTISQATTHKTTPLKLFSFHAPCPTPNIHSHSSTNSTTQSTMTYRYTTHLLPLYGVHLFRSLFILLIWTTITFHSYCPKLSHNILHSLLYLPQQTTQHLSTFTITSRFTYL